MAYRIKNWSSFQHFKDRRPPWVKLYRDLLDDIEWHELDPKAAKGLVMLWLIASENNGELPEVKQLAFRLRTSCDEVIQLLNSLNHWLIHDDIDVISPRHHDDAPETETETETETESAALRTAESKPATVRQGKFDPLKVDLPESVSPGTWELWVSYRRQRRLSCARMCVEQQIANLSAWAGAGHDPDEIVRASIANGWQGLFEPKAKPAAKVGLPAEQPRARVHHLGFVEEWRDVAGGGWRVTEFKTLADWEAARGVSV